MDLFYETKANLRKDQIRLLKRAGITKLQPGVESLIDDVLKLMRKGVGALHNIQLLKWCKELGVKPHWNVLWGFPGEPPEEYERLAAVVPLLRHLPPPGGFGQIRLDRFSPNFFDAERLGFKDVRPLAPYRHVYPLPDDVLRNLAYYFSYDYQEPRDVAGLRPRAWRASCGAWKRDGTSELFAVPCSRRARDRRHAAGRAAALHRAARPGAGAVRGLRRGRERRRTSRPPWSAPGFGRLPDAAITDALAPLVERGFVLRDGPRYLALAVGVGEHVPATPAARALVTRARAFGVRRRRARAA